MVNDTYSDIISNAGGIYKYTIYLHNPHFTAPVRSSVRTPRFSSQNNTTTKFYIAWADSAPPTTPHAPMSLTDSPGPGVAERRRGSNSLIHRHYESTQPTVRLTIITKNTFTDSELVKDITHTESLNRVVTTKRERATIDRTISTYILTKTPRTFHTLPDLQATRSRPSRKFVTDIISKNRSETQTNKLNSATQ